MAASTWNSGKTLGFLRATVFITVAFLRGISATCPLSDLCIPDHLRLADGESDHIQLSSELAEIERKTECIRMKFEVSSIH